MNLLFLLEINIVPSENFCTSDKWRIVNLLFQAVLFVRDRHKVYSSRNAMLDVYVSKVPTSAVVSFISTLLL